MLRFWNAFVLYLIHVIVLTVARSGPNIPTATTVLKSLAELNAAVASVPLLLVLFEPYPARISFGTIHSEIECSTKCEELLSLCNRAAALQLPKRSRITCGHAQGDREWMKMCVFFHLFCVKCVRDHMQPLSVFSQMSQHRLIIHHRC
jgi:hypothetical protein